MIISMSDIICVTNRALCAGDFSQRIRQIASARPAGIILREKDLTEEAYEALAGEILRICQEYQVPCMLHSFVKAAQRLEAEAIHLPMPVLREMTGEQKQCFQVIGASCHSVEEAKEAERLGCTYLTAGHIFNTDCKKGLPGRGLDFLQNICSSVSVPVYAIGGIDSSNIEAVRLAEAKGACIMSGLMKCKDPASYMRTFK